MKSNYLLLIGLGLAFASCRETKSESAVLQEDLKAKQMLQGVWVNDESQDVAFRVKGDTIYYPDSISQPVYFQIFKDTIVFHGTNERKYPILRQTPHLFKFKNLNGEEVVLTLSNDADDITMFSVTHPIPLNQNQLIKRDTLVSYNDERYHCYVQVNPTTYKVIKTTYNDEGVAVDNFYYDNIINLHVYRGGKKIFSSDFHKHHFEKQVPVDFLNQSVLSDLLFKGIDSNGIHYMASLVIPDSMSSFQVEVVIGFSGRLRMIVNQ